MSEHVSIASPLPGFVRPSFRGDLHKAAISEATPSPQAAAAAVAAGGAASSSSSPASLSASRRNRANALANHVPQEVLAERGSGKVLEYRVKWKGINSSKPTWELGSQLVKLAGFEEALERFKLGQKASKGGGGGLAGAPPPAMARQESSDIRMY